ncbi:SH3 domain-containing protein [Marinilactibacillus sp. XAAS-LB27]|uniref:SH3 domain-containing protein n=1 Tax=Marinilactibacillus sp. XAAS-LB27 TaxID=3114538 RepID=UPI002E171B05|nr:SH3 domain-containing protein [Marinilactibacillus sp. XAAS-LB27]
MKDKKPAIIAVLSIILVLLLVFIVQDVRTNQSRSSEETTDTNQQPSTELPAETNEPDPEPVEEPKEPEVELPIWNEVGPFELPIVGAGGYTSIKQNLHEQPSVGAPKTTELAAGTAFSIENELNDWWQIRTISGETGWLEHRYAMINLPDIIPSIIYDHSNSYDAKFTSSFVPIPELTGQSLYDMRGYNERLSEETFIMPILYQTARKVQEAQRIALQNGESLKVYETFRPRDVQLLVNDALNRLADTNAEVKKGITAEPWSMTWFINTSVSNHQRGLAIDLTLVKIDELSEQIVGDYYVPEILNYTEYQMQTPFHELSTASAMFTEPIAARDQQGWRNMELSNAVTEPALRMQNYMTEAGFTPLASEWWHFNDIDALDNLKESAGTGEFRITEVKNNPPKWQEVE